MKDMNWIDDNVAVGDYLDKYKVPLTTAIIDVRDAFQMESVYSTLFIVQEPYYFPLPLVHTIAGNIIDHVRRGGKVLIHCTSGIDRAPFVATVYYMKRYGVAFDKAYDEVAFKRPQTIQHWDWKEYL